MLKDDISMADEGRAKDPRMLYATAPPTGLDPPTQPLDRPTSPDGARLQPASRPVVSEADYGAAPFPGLTSSTFSCNLTPALQRLNRRKRRLEKPVTRDGYEYYVRLCIKLYRIFIKG